MSEPGSDFLSDIARKVADIDARADAEIADILAGRPFHRRINKAKAEAAAAGGPAPAKKPRAKRQPRAKTS